MPVRSDCERKVRATWAQLKNKRADGRETDGLMTAVPTTCSVRVRIGNAEAEVSWSGRLTDDIDAQLRMILAPFESRIPGRAPNVDEPSNTESRPSASPSPASRPRKPTSPGLPKRRAGGKHGGTRVSSVARGLDRLIADKWLVEKTQPEIISKLRERFPGVDSDNILHALKRRLNKTLVKYERGDETRWSVMER
jgi:hypothetical protein